MQLKLTEAPVVPGAANYLFIDTRKFYGALDLRLPG